MDHTTIDGKSIFRVRVTGDSATNVSDCKYLTDVTRHEHT